jgi:putative nucleotidyltransferase with HDIG domain
MDVINAGLRSHCLRVAAWAQELAGKLKLTADEERLLEESALLHHMPLELLETDTVNRLLGELWPAEEKHPHSTVATGAGVVLPEKVRELLGAMRYPAKSQGTDRISALANILEIADLFDEQLEMAQFEGRAVRQVLEAASDDPVLGAALGSLRKASRADLLALIPKLPVYPEAAMRALNTLQKPEVHLRELEEISTLDQVLAGQLLQAANSVFFAPRYPIKTVRDAIGFIGLESTRQILSAAALRPLFAAPKLKKLWMHSIETAQVAERIAEMSATVSPREAFLAGLVHDIGRLAITQLPSEVSKACERLAAKGCETTVAELVLLGFDHSEAGAEVLAIWKFPSDMVKAIRYHHNPDRADSSLAALLYLTEFWSAADEDLPSNAVLQSALKQVGISPEQLGKADLSRAGAVQVLA